MYILHKAIKQDLCPFSHSQKRFMCLLCQVVEITKRKRVISEYGFPLVRLMIIFESSHDHLGASSSNIGRIRTKENIAVDTHLIGILPNPLGGFLIIFES